MTDLQCYSVRGVQGRFPSAERDRVPPDTGRSTESPLLSARLADTGRLRKERVCLLERFPTTRTSIS
jgi:hypothetical protein